MGEHPTAAATVTRRLDTTRTTCLDQLAAKLQQRASALPTTRWPAGLLGRRDVLLLTLAAAGMTCTQITCLRRGDLTTDDGGVLVVTVDGEQFGLHPARASTPSTPRPADVLAHLASTSTPTPGRWPHTSPNPERCRCPRRPNAASRGRCCR